jgi:hypothetical protein
MICLLHGTAHPAQGADDDLRYLVARLRQAFPGVRIVLRADRGESENRNKELKCGLQADRLSDHRYLANLFRLYLHTAAYNLLVRLRRLVADPPPPSPDAEVPAGCWLNSRETGPTWSTIATSASGCSPSAPPSPPPSPPPVESRPNPKLTTFSGRRPPRGKGGPVPQHSPLPNHPRQYPQPTPQPNRRE